MSSSALSSLPPSLRAQPRVLDMVHKVSTLTRSKNDAAARAAEAESLILSPLEMTGAIQLGVASAAGVQALSPRFSNVTALAGVLAIGVGASRGSPALVALGNGLASLAVGQRVYRALLREPAAEPTAAAAP